MRPHRGLLAALALWLAAGLVAAAWPALAEAWGGMGGALLLLALYDARALRRLGPIQGRRRLPATLALGVEREVSLRLANPGTGRVVLEVYDHHPPDAEVAGLPRRIVLEAGGYAEFAYGFRPGRRGEHRFGRIELLVHSPLRLWKRRSFAGEETGVRVFPNFAAVAKYALLATDNRLSQMGIRKRRRRGEGMEFHQLREYRTGDSLRQVDWKATSRLRRLISREHQDERDQQVFFLVDCGRRMLAQDGALSHFDHSLNSVLLLGHVALKQGDAVGLMTFSGPPRFVPPRKGPDALNAVLGAVYDLMPGLASPDYSSAATEVMGRLRKRSLVVIVTNLRDEDSQEILPLLRLLNTRHLVLLASLRESVIGDVLKQPVEDFEGALRLAATQKYLLARRKIHDAIARHGALSLDVEPARLPVAMVNRYLEIKRSGKL